MRADIERDRSVADAKEKVLAALKPLSNQKAARVIAAVAILTGHGALVGYQDPPKGGRQ